MNLAEVNRIVAVKPGLSAKRNQACNARFGALMMRTS